MMMIDDHENEDRWIDRLVDGELPEPERLALIARLDADPSGWRRCALAFLEAQTWREALGPVASNARVQTAPIAIVPKAPRWPIARTATLIAASVLMAFSLGWLSRGHDDSPPTVVAKVDAGLNASAPRPPEPETIVKVEAPPVDPIVARLESQGYQVDRRQRIVSVETPDGRRVAVPVAEVRLKYVGDRTY